MIEVLHPRRSRGLLSGLKRFISAPMCALLLAMAMQAASLPMFSRVLPEDSTTHYILPPFAFDVGASSMRVDSTEDAYGLTYAKTAPVVDDRHGRDLGSLSTPGVLDAYDATSSLGILDSFHVWLGPSFLANFFAAAPSDGTMELMVHPTARTTSNTKRIRLDSLLCDLLACCIVANIMLLAWSGTCARGAHGKAGLSYVTMLLLLQGGAVFLPAAEAASIENAISQPVEMAQMISSAGATVHVVDMAEPRVTVTQSGFEVVSHALRRLATTTVSPGAGTLQTAIDAATAGDVLELADGTYTGSGDEVLLISKDITIRAKNVGQAVLDGENARRVIKITSGTVVLEGLKIFGGRGIGLLGVSFRPGWHTFDCKLAFQTSKTLPSSPQWGACFY